MLNYFRIYQMDNLYELEQSSIKVYNKVSDLLNFSFYQHELTIYYETKIISDTFTCFTFSDLCSKLGIKKYSKIYLKIHSYTSFINNDSIIPIIYFERIIQECTTSPFHFCVQQRCFPEIDLSKLLKRFDKPTEIYSLSILYDYFAIKNGYLMLFQYPIISSNYILDSVLSINGILIAIEINENDHRDRNYEKEELRKTIVSKYFESSFEISVPRIRTKKQIENINSKVNSYIPRIASEVASIEKMYVNGIEISTLIPESIEQMYINMISLAIISKDEYPITLEESMEFLGIRDKKSAYKVLHGYYSKHDRLIDGLEFIEIKEQELIDYCLMYSYLSYEQKIKLYVFKSEVLRLLNKNGIKAEFDKNKILIWGGQPPLNEFCFNNNSNKSNT